jgi:hypothetical protein
LPFYFRLVILAECVVYTVATVLWEYGVVRCLIRFTSRRKIAEAAESAQAEYRRSLIERS